MTASSPTTDWMEALDKLHRESIADKARVTALEEKLTKKNDDRAKDWTELKSFQALGKFSGSEKDFADWEFKLQRFVRPFKEMEVWLDWVKDMDTELSLSEAGVKQREMAQKNPDIDLAHYDEQFYGVLSLQCEGTALQTVKNQREDVGVRGANAWWKLTREVAGKTGVRLEHLADKVHNPKAFTYKEGLAHLEQWETDRRELEKIEGQGLSDLTKRTTLKKMLPRDLL